MNVDALSDGLRKMPSYIRLMGSLVDELRGGKSMLVVTGSRVSTVLIQQGLADALFREGASFQLSPATVQEGQSPADTLAEALPHLGPDELAATADGDFGTSVHTIVWIEGLSSAPKITREQWTTYLSQRARFIAQPTVVCVAALRWPLPASALTEQRLVVKHLWDLLSLLEMQLMIRLADDDTGSPAARWREAVLPHLSAGDVELAATLWSDVTASEGRMLETLRGEVLARNLQADVIARAVAQTRGASSAAVPGQIGAEWFGAWMAGAAHATPELGAEISALGYAAIGDDANVRLRLWRGEMALLLPLVTEIRIEICRQLREVHGADWASQFAIQFIDREDERRRVREDCLATELGPLGQALESTAIRNPRLAALVRTARRIRNELAHCRPVQFSDYLRLHDESMRALGPSRA